MDQKFHPLSKNLRFNYAPSSLLTENVLQKWEIPILNNVFLNILDKKHTTEKRGERKSGVASWGWPAGVGCSLLSS
jgi:hypothetical protein